jgi:exodeoxyribonuclease VII large subunit
LEDLWAFNEEVVARAIARSNVPVISAVGHEIDFTIADFVADVRAPTPSAAAEMVVGCKESFEERLDVARRRLASCLAQRVLRARNRLLHVAGCRVLNQPSAVVAQQTQRLDDLRMRMAHTVSGRVGEGRQWLADHSHRLLHAVRLRQQACRHRLVAQEGQFRALSPLAVLSRGYSVTRTATGRVVRSCRDVAVGVEMETVVADGRLRSVVRECQACNGQADAIEGDRALRTGGPRTPVQ